MYSQSLVDERLAEAYVAVREVSESQGEAGPLVELLNQAIAEAERGVEPSVVLAHLDAVIQLAAEERARSIEAYNYGVAGAVIQAAIALALVYATWRYFPRIFWRAWLRLRGGWLVEHADR